ncbi:helix-turn-helix domain-containing protein [Haladaptatus caseinilyticus]|uniref:helix-turn-helix domain-containing protein n=1 Tax=Haladaptatus caseinilyticus TaxID=2993314 RepID=UPI00224B0393|nr:helix-turn-helix domain-containing protein [Haladaptatus caseinilyticus]
MEKFDTHLNDVRSIELDNAFYVEDGTWIESLTVSSTSDFDLDDLITKISGVQLYYTRDIPTGPSGDTVRRLTILANESYPFILGLILRREAIPNRIVLQDGTFDVVVTVRTWEHFRSLADELQDALGGFDLKSMNEIDNPGEPLDSGRLTEVLITKLADKQLSVLETAYNMGYFEVPREVSAQNLADELDISQSTLSERLRTAERNLLELIYGPRE